MRKNANPTEEDIVNVPLSFWTFIKKNLCGNVILYKNLTI